MTELLKPSSTGEKRKMVTVSVKPGKRDTIDSILTEIKNREMSVSSTVCRLLVEFRDGGFVFKDKVMR